MIFGVKSTKLSVGSAVFSLCKFFTETFGFPIIIQMFYPQFANNESINDVIKQMQQRKLIISDK